MYERRRGTCTDSSRPEDGGGTQGRKLFGGYKITPRPCQGSKAGLKEAVTGICMFNYECSRRSGEVVGTCTDSFLFGACCRLPPGAVYAPDDVDELVAERPENNKLPVAPTRPPPTPAPPPGSRPVASSGTIAVDPLDSAMINDLFLNAALHRPPAQGTYASPDTVLLHKNGSVVTDEGDNLEELLFNRPLTATSKSPPDTSASGLDSGPATGLGSAPAHPELTTFSYVTGPDGAAATASSPSSDHPHPTTKLVSHFASTGRPYPSEPTSWDQIVQSNSIQDTKDDKEKATTSSSSTKPYVAASTTFYTQPAPPRITKPTFYSSTTKWHTTGVTTQRLPSFRPKPSTPSPPKLTSKRPVPTLSDHFVQVPLVTANSQNGVTLPDTPADDNIEVATNAASISHILSILNNSSPTLIDQGPDPVAEPEAHPDPHNTTSGVSTWVSVNGDKPKPLSQQFNTDSTESQDDDDDLTTPSKEYPTETTSNLVTLSTFYSSKRPASTQGSSYYTSVPTRQPPPRPTPRPTTRPSARPSARPTVRPITARPPTSTTVKVHGPGFGVKPSTPQYYPSSSPASSHYSAEPSTAYETTVLFNPDVQTNVQDDDYYPTVSVTPPPADYGHYSPYPSAYPPTPPPPIHSHYEAPLTASPPPPVPSTSLRPPKPSPMPPPAPTVIVLGPYDPVTNPSSGGGYPTRRPAVPVSSTTESSALPSPNLVYTQVPSNHGQGGTVTIITKRPQRPSSVTASTTTTVTKRTPITISTSSYTTPQPIVSSEIVQTVSAQLGAGTISPGRPQTDHELVAFPPVRDPNLNVTSYPGHTTINDEDYTEYPPEYTEYTTPHLDDTNLDNKVHGFVDKIVQSLQGNFEELENVLFSGDNSSSSAKPVFYTTTTRRPTILSTLATSLRPTRTTTRRPPTRPSKPSTATITITTRKPPTKRPTTQATTKRPTTRPKPSTVPTRRPKPTKKKPTTTPPPEEDEDEDEDDQSSTSGYGSSSTATAEDWDTPDYRSQCGVRPHVKSGRVVGGKGARFGEWPWQVLVRESTWLGLFTKNKCGGVLITQKYVITAAHCQPGFLASLVAVFGEYDISGELEPKRSVSKNVRRVIVHRQYDAATFENDLALLELESPVSYDTHIVPICMPQDGEDFTGRMATVTGWGRLKYGGGVPSVLQEVQVPVIENSVCQEMFQTSGHAKNIIGSFLCAGYANGQRDSCEGDSGGPLMVERDDGHWVLVGTVSHGIKCAAPYLPGVYMRTTFYKPWLKSITGVS